MRYKRFLVVNKTIKNPSKITFIIQLPMLFLNLWHPSGSKCFSAHSAINVRIIIKNSQIGVQGL